MKPGLSRKPKDLMIQDELKGAKTMDPIIIIMAGGRGERFWPRSRVKCPKQLLNLAGEASLLQQTVARIRQLTPSQRILVVTNKDYADIVREQLPFLPVRNILVEPESRNTAPCIALAAIYIRRFFPEEDPPLAILPSDLLITNDSELQRILQVGLMFLEKSFSDGSGIIYGARPTRPETGFGYIQTGERIAIESGVPLHQVISFREKPDYANAVRYLTSGEYLWNGGIFIWRHSQLLTEYQTHLPELAGEFETFTNWIGTTAETERLEQLYSRITPLSFDHGVLEQSQRLMVIPADYAWDDLGTWSALGRVTQPDTRNNVIQAEHIAFDTHGCIVYSPEKFVGILGVQDLIVVESGDVLLICHKERAQDIKMITERLREMGREDLL